MILFTPVPAAVATPETALAAIATATGPSDASRATAGAGRASANAIATATGPPDASRATGAGRASATAATLRARRRSRPCSPAIATARLPAATRALAPARRRLGPAASRGRGALLETLAVLSQSPL